MSPKSNTKNVPIVHKDDTSFFHTFDQIQEKIRRRAYEYFADRGFSHGDPMMDWLMAENDVLAKVSLKATENDKEWVIEGKVDGFAPGEIEVKVEGDALLVTGHHNESSEDNGDVYVATSQSTSFMQRFQLPANIDREHLEASMKSNTLRVSIPKSNQT